MSCSNLKWIVVMLGMLAFGFRPWIPVDAAPLQIDPQRSEIEVKVRTTVNSFTAKLQTFKADIDYGMNTNLPNVVSLSFDFNDLKTGIKLRDQHMLEWLHYSTNAMGTFDLTGWKRDETNDVAIGTLMIHGVRRVIEIPVSITHDHGSYEINGQTDLDYRNFGLPVIRKALLFSVNPRLTVKFHLIGELNSKTTGSL